MKYIKLACFVLILFTPHLAFSLKFAEEIDPDPQTIVVIGGGPTSLGFLYRFYEQGGMRDNVKILAFEQEAGPGGLARSERDLNGFLFDYGGHVVFSHYTYFDDVLDRSIPDWNYINRESYVFMEGSDGINRFIPYPLQNNIHAMEKNDCVECLKDLELLDQSHGSAANNPSSSFKDWLLWNFGSALCNKFMYPYNKKIWTVDLSEMNATWIRERVARPNLQQIKSKVDAIGENKNNYASESYFAKDDGWGPNNKFRYPAKGGMGSIWEAIAGKIPKAWMHYGKRIISIDTERKLLWVEDIASHDIEEISYDVLVSTMPLDQLIDIMIAPDDVEPNRGQDLEAIKILKSQKAQLIHSSTHVIGLGIKGALPEFLKNKSWIYFPDSQAPFYRITVFSNYSQDHIPHGEYWSLICEVSEPATAAKEQLNDGSNTEKIMCSTIEALVKYGYLCETDIVSTFHKKLEYGYPVPFLARDDVLNSIQPILESKSIFSRGRFGGWKYEVSNQDHCFMQGVELSDFVFKSIPEMTLNHPNQVNAPGKRESIQHSSLDQESLGMKVEYVIAHYKENLEWLLPVKNQTHIYHKGGNKVSLNDFRLVETLPNVGREGHTYLRHIIDNYDRLADATFFFQGNIEDHFSTRISPKKMLFTTRKRGVAFSSFIRPLINRWGFAREWLGQIHLGNMTFSQYTFANYWEYIFMTGHPEQIPVTYGGCFSVTKEKIRAHPKEFYMRILNTLDSSSNPEEGHYLERMWVTIFK